MRIAIRFFLALALLTGFGLAPLSAQGNFDFSTACFHDETVFVRSTGATELTTCAGDGVSDRIRFTVSNLFMAFGYVVVDENDVIVSIGFSNFIDFEMLPGGTLRVYAFSTFGLITANVGDDFNTTPLSVPCFGLTSNFVTVNNASPGDVTISTPSGETEFNTCPGDGIPDEISFLSDGTLPNTAFIVTDANNVVLTINTSGTVDFDGAGTGTCRVYAASFSGTLMLMEGDDLDDIDISDNCGGVSDNFITVNRQDVEGGTVSTTDGETMVLTCPDDGIDDVLQFSNTGSSGTNFTYVVTDADGNILGIPSGNEVNFEDAGVGTCRLYGLSFEGNLTAEPEDNINTSELADGCYALSSNFVSVVREVAVAGSVTTTDGDTEIATCPGDGNADLIEFSISGQSGGTSILVVTDENGVVLGLPPGTEVDFEDAGTGTCRVYTLTYQGDLLLAEGDQVDDFTFSTSCSDLSDDFATVIRTVPSGGTVATVDGETEVITCPGDGVNDFFSFVSTGAEGSNFTYVVTDADGMILNIPPGNQANFEGAGLGACRLYGLSYEGSLLAAAGNDINADQLADGCFTLSDNFVTVNRIEPVGGTVATTDGATEISTCTGDGIADFVSFTSTGALAPRFDYVVTDENGIILGIPVGDTVDFELAGTGNCRVYGLAYDGAIIAAIGNDINTAELASGCYELSDNFITVIRSEAEGGTVSTEDGETTVTTCPGDGVPDLIQFDSTGTTLDNFVYIIADTNDVIIGLLFSDQFNFDPTGTGISRIYGFGYNGSIIGAPGDTLGVSQLATECAVLSDNFVTIIRETPDGGSVATEDGETEIFICPGDMISDLVAFDSSGVSGGNFTYVVTDSNGIVLGVPDGDVVDFETAGLGTCRLYGLVYQGNLLVEAGDEVGVSQLADGCFSVSDNFVTVNRQNVTGGTVATVTGADTVFTCPGDGIDDFVTVSNSGSQGPDFVYVITDDMGTVLDVSTSGDINFEGAGEGTCRVYGLAFAGDVLAEMGDEIALDTLATGCFSLTDNFITVIRTQPVGGTISTLGGSDVIDVCSGDLSPDLVNFTVSGNSNGGYIYVVAQDNIILAGLSDDSFDFNNAISGTYQIFGLAYAGTPILIPGDDIMTTDLASSCFDLTSNFLTVNVEQVDACELRVVGSDSDVVYLCASNPNDGQVDFFSCSALSDTNYQYVITTDSDVILFTMDGPGFDFGAVPLPEVRVYAISYTGMLNNLIGTTVTTGELSDGCFAVTDNFITIINGQPEAGEISLSEDTPEPFCVANGNGLITVNTTSTANVGYAIIVTDTAGIVQQVNLGNQADFTDLPSGNYLIYGVSYTGNVTVEVGDDLELVAIADNCFEVTEEPIEFYRAEDVDGGIVSTQTGQDTFYVCPGDNTPDILAVSTTVSGVPYRYLVTDALGNIIIPESFSNIFNFEDAIEGTCRVYGYTFSGNITASFGQNVATAMLSDSCFALSENYITVIRQSADGGTVATTEGDTTVTIDLASGNTTVTVVSTGAADQIGFTYVITDAQNFVLGFGDGPTFDFASAGAGVCRIWGLSYQGELLLQIGDSATDSELADGCFTLSDNFIEVTRTEDGLQNGDDNSIPAGIALSAYPNPVSGGQLHLVIQSDEVLEDGQAFIRDQNGRSWISRPVAGGSHSATLDVDISNLPNGLFIVQYRAGNRQEVIRFLRQ